MTRTDLAAFFRWPRRLPLIDKPATREHIDSYIRRLGRLNHIDHDDMAELLGTKPHLLRHHNPFVHTDITDRLAALTGYSTDRLRRVFPPAVAGPPPESTRSEPVRTAADHYHPVPLKPCEHCTATRRPIHAPFLRCWRLLPQRVCTRHRRWIGPGSDPTDTDQFDLTAVPEITAAGRRLTNLVSKHGRARARKAVDLAEQLVHKLLLGPTGTFKARAERLGIAGWYHRADSLTHAVAFPEVVILTRLLCSGYWRTVLSDPDDTVRAAAQRRFETRVNTDLRPLSFWEWSMTWHERGLLAQWVSTHDPSHSSSRPSRPSRKHRAGSP